MSSLATDATTTREEPVGTLSPLRIRIFRAVWIAALASNLGTWMHLVAASWLMTSLTRSAMLVALLSTAFALPSFVLTMPAGAMADCLTAAG